MPSPTTTPVPTATATSTAVPVAPSPTAAKPTPATANPTTASPAPTASATVTPTPAPPTPAAPSTASAWLTKNQASDYTTRFHEKGYDDVADLLPEVIRTVLQGEAPGVIDRLVRIRNEELQKPQRQPLPAPVLKPGMELDLSAPVLKGLGDVSLKLPDLGFAAGTGEQPVVSAGTLGDEEWIALALNSDMLMGLDLEAFFEGESSVPQECFSPALWWKVPDSKEFFNCEHLSARINTEITYTAQSATMVTSGFTSVTASVTTPWVSASVSHEESYKRAQSSRKSTLYIVGMYDFDRVRVDLEQCTVVSPRFVSAVEHALAQPNPKDALAKVFQKYGQIIGRQVTLGGRLFFVHAKEEMESSQVESLKNSTSVAVAGAYGAFGGSVGVSSGTGSESSQSNQHMNERISFQAIGGDVTLANEPEKWKDTIKSPSMWEVIRYDKIRYTYELLSEELQQLVLMYWERPIGAEDEPIVISKPKVEMVKSSDGMSVTGFMITFEKKVPGLSMRYWATTQDGTVKNDWIGESSLCGSKAIGASPLQEFLIELTGGLAKRYDLHYRARIVGGAYTDWVSGKELCGLKGQRIEEIQVEVSPVGGGILRIPAETFIPGESKGAFDVVAYGPGVVWEKDTTNEWLLTYRFVYAGSKPVRRRLEGMFASGDNRSVKVEFNGQLVNESAFDYGTGGWDMLHQCVSRMGTVSLQPGANTLKISRKAVGSPHIREFRLVAEVVNIPALSFVSTTGLGQGCFGSGVMNQVTGDSLVSARYEFNFAGKKPATLRLEGVYTAGDSRPVKIVINPQDTNPQTFTDVLGKVTGSWYKDKQRTDTIAEVVVVQPGKNVLVLSRTGAIPHIQEFRLVLQDPFLDFDSDVD